MRMDIEGPIGSGATRLIVIRGSSGSGKSSLAAGIRRSRPDRTVAIVGQDLIRRDLLGVGDDLHGHATAFIDMTTRLALARGFDVVLEGILNAEWYSAVLRRLVDDHYGTSHCYLFDVSFEETVRRHATRPVASAFGEAELRAWWRGPQPVDGLGEAVITEHETLETTVERIVAECWPIPS